MADGSPERSRDRRSPRLRRLLTEGQMEQLNREVSESDFCGRLAAARGRGDFKQRVRETIRRLGFSDFGFLRMRDAHDLAGWIFTLPKDILKHYHHNMYHDHEHVWQHLLNKNSPVFCSSLYHRSDTSGYTDHQIKCSQATERLMTAQGYYDAYGIPLESAIGNGYRAVFFVFSKNLSAAKFRRQVTGRKKTLALLDQAIDHVSSHHFPEFYIGSKSTRQVPMTPASIRVFCEMVRNDWTIRQTAIHLGVHPRSVVHHLAAIKRELGTGSLTNATYLAIKKGWFDKGFVIH